MTANLPHSHASTLPRLSLKTASAASFLVSKHQGMHASLPDLPLFKTEDAVWAGAGVCKLDGVLQLEAAIDEAIRGSSGLIINSYEDLEQQCLTKLSEEFSNCPVFAVGPFNNYFPASSSSLLPHDRSCISWLDKQAPNSVIYVSFGSVANISEAEFLEVAWGLANSNQPFLWVVRPGLVDGSEWLEPLPKGFLEMVGGRGHIVKWAPQQQVLAHPSIGAFWTHCGWNSTLESLCEGVPMICHPTCGDQKVNARYVSDVWRVGVHLEYEIERDKIEKAISRLMVEAEGQEMRDRVKLMKENINLALKPGGSSYKSLDNLVAHILSFNNCPCIDWNNF